MKIIYNRFIPCKGFLAMNLFGVLFVRWEKGKPKPILSKCTINHESIHTEQMKELGYIFFYIWYVIEWFIKLFTTKNAYKSISFEREAYGNERNLLYLEKRKKYAWFKYISNKYYKK